MLLGLCTGRVREAVQPLWAHADAPARVRQRFLGLWAPAAWVSTPREMRYSLRQGQLSGPQGQLQVLQNGAHPTGWPASTRRLPPHLT